QEKLTLDFCQTAFVDRGMVADIAIHRDDKKVADQEPLACGGEESVRAGRPERPAAAEPA
ncbi:hypothetical protein, partial [Streptomyces sp. NPDC096934]|uniref:hypothetical protein n=1 Tax=Streptomyces sp. NPDC096934 TaxID=3155551 RepID=UPI0033348CD2